MNITKTTTYQVLVIMILVGLSLSIKVKLSSGIDQNQRMWTEKQLQAFSNVKLIIDGTGEYIYQEANNLFSIPEMGGGVHIVEAISNDFLFPVLLIDQRVEGTPKMKWFHPLDRKMIKIVQEPTITPLDKIKFYEPEAGSFLMGALMGGNGLFILMGVLMVLCYKGLNKLNESQLAPAAS